MLQPEAATVADPEAMADAEAAGTPAGSTGGGGGNKSSAAITKNLKNTL